MVDGRTFNFVRAQSRRVRYCLLFFSIAGICFVLLTRMNKRVFCFPPCSNRGSTRSGNISVSFIIAPSTIGIGRDNETGLLMSGMISAVSEMMGPANLGRKCLDLLFWSSRSRVVFPFFIFVGDDGPCWGCRELFSFR